MSEILYEPPGIRDIVASIKFMPGWDAYIDDDNDRRGFLTLHIISCTPDSYNPDRKIRVNHSFILPPTTWNDRTWKAWIFERYVDVWRHEVGEFLMFDGVREFAPHHGDGEDPYITWHVGDLADTDVPAGKSKEQHLKDA